MRSDQLPAPSPLACSVRSAELGEPLAGTAATQSAWLLLEQPGPWGRDAATESRLDPELGAELAGRTAGTGVRLALIRRPETGREHEPVRRRWFAASTHPARTWLATGLLEFPTDLLRIDFAALDAGDRSAVSGLAHSFVDQPVLGVCTNGKRDQCCATLGRKVAVAADALDRAACATPGGGGGAGRFAASNAASSGASTGDSTDDEPVPSVWEITHVGGHKFSPTGVLLPSGYLYGRLDAARAARVLSDARRETVLLDGARGRCTWSRPGQAAELAVRAEIGERGLTALTVASVERTSPEPNPAWTVVVEHEDARAFEVSVVGALAAVPRPESCGKADGTPLELRVVAMEKIR